MKKIETNEVEMSVDRDVFENSVVINFDMRDTDTDEVIAQGGYVHVRQGSNSFQVFVFNSDGDVLSNTVVPFNFKAEV